MPMPGKVKVAPRPKARNKPTASTQDQTPDLRQQICQVVAMIPPGKVASYGQVARLVGFPGHARYVGTTLRQLPKRTKLPWYRVVNSSLKIAQRGGGEARQKRLLEAEGVTFIGARIASAHHWDADAV